MEDRYLQILSYLEGRGIDIETLITGLMYDLFSNKEELNQPSDWTTEYVINRFISVMETNGHVTTFSQEDPNNKEKVRVILRLTPDGFKYLNEHRLTQSNIALNQSTISNNKIVSENTTTQSSIFKLQTAVFIFGALFACGSFIVSYDTYVNINETKHLKYQVQQLKKDSTLLQKKLSIQLKKDLENGG